MVNNLVVRDMPMRFVAIFYNRVYKSQQNDIAPIDTKLSGDPALGLSVELCAGIIDKDKSLAQIASEEVREEVGFNVPVDKLEKVVSLR